MRRAAPVLIGLFLAAAFPAAAAAATVGHWKLDETSGNTVIDSSGSGNNGTSQNMNLGLDGFTGNTGDRAYGYNGTSSRITVPGSDSLVAGTKDVTISFYFHSTAHAGNGSQDWDMVKKGGYKVEIYKQKKKEQARCVFIGTNGKIAFQDGPVLTNGQWHHVVCARTGNTATLTVDGVSFPPRTGSLGTLKKGQELTIGWGSDGTDFFDGTLDDVEIDIG
jgi:Concanavalin A-like lectin/glucanases superfamily